METAFPIRKIIHVDMDAYYASVEQLDNPDLAGKPLAVGGGGTRGVVSAASYEARKFGVRSAMSGVIAKKNCPELIFVPPRFERYTEISNIIRKVFFEFTDMVEPLSLDEAYLDVTQNKTGNPSATLLAREIREKIFQKTGLNASAGISVNKFLAKVASDINKPNGQKTIPPEEVIAFLEALDVRKFYGVGKVTREKLYQMGIFTGDDLKAKPLEFLQNNFGKSGQYFYDVVRGINLSEVKSDRTRKSMAAERTFNENITSEVYMLERLENIAKEIERRLDKSNIAGKTITLKIKYSDFSLQTRSKTMPYYIAKADLILQVIQELLYQEKVKESVRLLGISVTNLNNTTADKKEIEPIIEQLKLEF